MPADAALLDPADAVLVVVDVQERLFPHIHDHEDVETNVQRLVRGARALDVPVLVTEQYVKGLGTTVPGVREALGDAYRPLEKTAFSCARDAGFRRALGETGRRSVLLCGIEAHICVMQTGLHLLAEGAPVHVVDDATGSRVPLNKEAGLRRLERAGAVRSTTEMALFELLGTKDHPRFKDVQALIK